MASAQMECPYCHQAVVPVEGPEGRLKCPDCHNTGRPDTPPMDEPTLTAETRPAR